MTFRPQDQVLYSRWRGGKQENQRNENMANNLSGAEWWGKDGLGEGRDKYQTKQTCIKQISINRLNKQN